ncbi:MAG: pitrilysin family protein [Planctomycetota bacterium]
MTRIWIVLAALLCVSSSAPAQKVQPESFMLDNGMEFLLLPRKEEPNIVFGAWLAKVGSVNERPGITGLSHFFEHMMFKGTSTIGTSDAKMDADLAARQHEVRAKLRNLHLHTQYSRWKKGEIDDPWDPKYDTDEMAKLRKELQELIAAHAEVIVDNEFDEIYKKAGGTGMNAFTSHDLTFYFIGMPTNKLELWAWMESDRLHDSVFREFYAEREVVHEERRMRIDSTPTGFFDEQFDALFWQSSPYSWPVVGWPTDISNYTIDQARDYYAKYYGPNNLVGIIVGDFDPATVKPMVTKYFGRLKKGPGAPVPATLEMKQMAEKRMYAEGDCQPQVEVRYHGVPFGHPDEHALEMAAEILNGRTGRLYKSLVEDQKIASGAGVRVDTRKYAGAFSFGAECKGSATPAEVEEAWYAELQKLQTEPVSERELQKVKNRVLADSFRRLQSNQFLAIQLAFYESMGGWEYINNAPDRMAAVTGEDIMEVMNKYFDESNRSVAIYTRKAGTASAANDELADIPDAVRPQVKQALQFVAQVSDPAQLEGMLAQIEQQAGQMPPEFKKASDYIKKKIQERLAVLKASSAGSDEAKPQPATTGAGADSGGE